jgi:hypothetical protein
MWFLRKPDVPAAFSSAGFMVARSGIAGQAIVLVATTFSRGGVGADLPDRIDHEQHLAMPGSGRSGAGCCPPVDWAMHARLDQIPAARHPIRPNAANHPCHSDAGGIFNAS